MNSKKFMSFFHVGQVSFFKKATTTNNTPHFSKKYFNFKTSVWFMEEGVNALNLVFNEL